MPKIKSFACILALLLAFGFCGMALANTGDYSGDWQGSWTSVFGPSGGLSTSITQTGTSISGTLSVFSTECGNFVGLSLSGTVYANDTATFYGSAYCSLDGQTYEIEYASGAVSGNTFSGTYTIYEAGVYFYDSGIFSVTRTVNIITASAGPGGTISPSGTVRVNAGASQTFTITPNTGYRISDVLVDGVSVGAVPSYTFSNIQSNHTIAAYFTVKVVSNPGIQLLLLDTDTFALRSSSFSNGAPIPVQYSLQGGNLSPPLSWSNAPGATKSFVLIMDDPDAPGGTWDHWIVYNIPTGTTSLAENAGASGSGGLPSGAVHGTNSWGNNYYQGPSPPSGTHRYYLKLYALSVSQLNPSGTTKAEIEAAMAGKILGQAELMGTYSYIE